VVFKLLLGEREVRFFTSGPRFPFCWSISLHNMRCSKKKIKSGGIEQWRRMRETYAFAFSISMLTDAHAGRYLRRLVCQRDSFEASEKGRVGRAHGGH
jgi:hypothetical protein